jgi:hypothetical protein
VLALPYPVARLEMYLARLIRPKAVLSQQLVQQCLSLQSTSIGQFRTTVA